MLALREVDRGIGAWLRASGAGGVLLLGLCLSEYEALAEPNSPRTEYFTGFEVSDNYASGYVGAGYALQGWICGAWFSPARRRRLWAL